MGSIALSIAIQGHRSPADKSSAMQNRTDTGGHGQTIDPPAKKLDHNGLGCSVVSFLSEKHTIRVSSLDTGGGIRLPSDGKKHDYADTGGGTLPGGSGKRFDVSCYQAGHQLKVSNTRSSV